jgi:hypothetical protein
MAVARRRGLLRSISALLLVVSCASAHAVDPITLLLLRALRDQILSASIQSAVEAAPVVRKPLPLPGTYTFDDTKLRSLIDEGFVHLSAGQRDEIYDSARRILRDPQHAASRPLMIEELALKAAAMREAHERLNNLSDDAKRAVAAQVRSEYEKMPVAERGELVQLLQSRRAPIPRDLNELILAAVGEADAASSVVRR